MKTLLFAIPFLPMIVLIARVEGAFSYLMIWNCLPVVMVGSERLTGRLQ